jgi:hypothetical protein
MQETGIARKASGSRLSSCTSRKARSGQSEVAHHLPFTRALLCRQQRQAAPVSCSCAPSRGLIDTGCLATNGVDTHVSTLQVHPVVLPICAPDESIGPHLSLPVLPEGSLRRTPLTATPGG